MVKTEGIFLDLENLKILSCVVRNLWVVQRFLNNSRGNVVDIEALAEALESKHVAGATIDVFPIEPASNNEEFISPLRKFDNVLLTPHIGGSTQEAQENIAVEVSNKLAQNHLIGSTAMAVNFPNLSLQKPKEGCLRITHAHTNTPGMLQAINQEISKYNLNIQSQILSTDSEIGYVVLDVEAKEVPKALKAAVIAAFKFQLTKS